MASLHNVDAGKNAPKEINVIIEIPARGEPVKYEVCKDSGALFVDRFLATAMRYPCNYGYIPRTLSEDSDPVDVLVVTPCPLIWGAVISCRPIGMLKMTDEKGIDAKVLAVPTNKLSREYDNVNHAQDLPKGQLEMIAHFFEHYKDLEEGKWVKIQGWAPVEEAHAEIRSSMARYKEQLATL